MADLLRRDAANLAITHIRGSVASYVNVPDTYINYAAAAGWGVSRTINAPDPIQYLAAGTPKGAQMVTMIQNYVTQCAHVLRLIYTRSGKWSLTADPWSTNQGDSWYSYSAGLPRPGVQSVYYGFVAKFTPVASQLTPTDSLGYTIFNTGQPASRSRVVSLLTNLGARTNAHMINNPIRISYCHTNCHNNCHASRGRR